MANIFKFPDQLYSVKLNVVKRLIENRGVFTLMMAVVLTACTSTPVSVEERDIEIPVSIEVDRPAPDLKNTPARDSNVERAEYYGRLSRLP